MIELTVVNRPVSLREETSILCLATYLYASSCREKQLARWLHSNNSEGYKACCLPFHGRLKSWSYLLMRKLKLEKGWLDSITLVSTLLPL